MSFSEILEQMGWQDGTYLPVANEENKALLKLLDARTKELEKLRSEFTDHDVKQKNLSHHKKNLQREHQENMRLLAIYKTQMDKEEHLNKVISSDVSRYSKDIEAIEKQYIELDKRGENIQGDIGRVLRRLEVLRGSVSNERGALDEWSSALKRREADIDAINRFSKEDNASLAELERKRQRLKVEHDMKDKLLTQVCKDLDADERSVETLSQQINHALARRRSAVAMWTGALENIRQKDKEMTYKKEELHSLQENVKKRSEYAKEKQEFLKIQIANYLEAERDLIDAKAELTRQRQQLVNMEETSKSMEAEMICLKRELMNTSNELSNIRRENKRHIEDKRKKLELIKHLKEQISKYKEKLGSVSDGSKTAAQRTRQLEDMLKSENKYIVQLEIERKRLQHCIFLAHQEVNALRDDGNLSKTEFKGYTISAAHLEKTELNLEKDLIMQQEILYGVDLRVQMAMSRMERLLGDVSEMASDSKDMERLQYLTLVASEQSKTVPMLAVQLTKLGTDLRFLSKNLDIGRRETDAMRSRLNEEESRAACNIRLCRESQAQGHAKRAEECSLRLRVAHAHRALKYIADMGYNIERARLDLNAAVSERTAEVRERRAVLMKQRRLLQDQRGSMMAALKVQQQRVEQLIKRYEISAASLGKDDNGEAYSIAYFKVKNAQEKSELQEKGDMLDSQIREGEREIASLEATLLVVDAANRRFVKSLNPIKDDDPDMLELVSLKEAYDNVRSVRSQVATQTRQLSDAVKTMQCCVTDLEPQMEEVHARRDDLNDELMKVNKDVKGQTEKLNRAIAFMKKSRVSARKKIKDYEIWNIHERDIQTRLISDANRSAGGQLRALTSFISDIDKRAALRGVHLSQVLSAPARFKLPEMSSERMSAASEQEPPVSCLTPSTRGSLAEELRAVRQRRTPLSDSQDAASSIRSDSVHTSRLSVHSSLPVSVVTLGLDPASGKDSSSKKYPSSGIRGKSDRSISHPSKKSYSSMK